MSPTLQALSSLAVIGWLMLWPCLFVGPVHRLAPALDRLAKIGLILMLAVLAVTLFAHQSGGLR